MGWIIAIVIGIAAGWIAEKLMKRNHGLLTNLIVGLVGALIGRFVLGLLGVNLEGDSQFLLSLGAAVLGAVILLFLLGLVKRR